MESELLKLFPQRMYSTDLSINPSPLYPSNVTPLQYMQDYTSILSAVDKKCTQAKKLYGVDINPYPYNLNEKEYQILCIFQRVLAKSLKLIVEAWINDNWLVKSQIKVQPNIESLLKLVYKKNGFQEIGSYRPDFVIGEGQMKFTEINARFTVNGYMMTQIGAEIGKIKSNEFPHIQNTSKLIENYFGDIDKINLAILKGQESGYDIHIFRQVSEKFNDADIIPPQNLGIDQDGNLINKTNKTIIKGAILEYHQSEILSLDSEVLQALAIRTKTLNPFLTIFLVHDKRMLSILSNKFLMKKLLENDEEVAILQKHINKSYVLDENLDEIILESFLAQKDRWLYKPALFGKGKGIVFGKNVKNREAWSHILEQGLKPKIDHPIIQEYLKPVHFNILRHNRVEKHFLVGTLLCLNDLLIGPGIYRSSPSDIVAISRGGSFLFPRLTSQETSYNIYPQTEYQDEDLNSEEDLNLSPVKLQKYAKSLMLLNNFTAFNKKLDQDIDMTFKEYRNSNDFLIFEINSQQMGLSQQMIEKYQKALVNDYVFLLKLNFSSQMKFINFLLHHFGGANTHSNIKDPDTLWPVTPSFSSQARSHSDLEFPFHTDASFEDPPPRYVMLYVQTQDKLGGGLSYLINMEQFIPLLPKSILEALLRPVYTFKIPNEFRKDQMTESVISGLPIVWRQEEQWHIRWRSDIITNTENLKQEEQEAIEYIRKMLVNDEEYIQQQIKDLKGWLFALEQNYCIFFDNTKFLHGRTLIKDKQRFLWRARFHGNW